MVSELAEYIKKQLDSGYDITTIKNFLINKKYPVNYVDSAINEVYRTMSPQKAMAPQYSPQIIPMPQIREDLVKFIKQYLEQGYRLEAIRNYLISKGYQSYDVENAINYSTQKTSQPTKPKLTPTGKCPTVCQ